MAKRNSTRRPSSVGKGLGALADAGAQVEVAEAFDVPEQEWNALLDSIAPTVEQAEVSLAEAERAIDLRTRRIATVQMTNETWKKLQNDHNSPVFALVEQRNAMRNILNSKATRLQEGIVIWRAPDNAEPRLLLEDVEKQLKAIRQQVGLFWAGKYGVDLDEAFKLVQDENNAWNQKNSQ